jgi:hypothetical protein
MPWKPAKRKSWGSSKPPKPPKPPEVTATTEEPVVSEPPSAAQEAVDAGAPAKVLSQGVIQYGENVDVFGSQFSLTDWQTLSPLEQEAIVNAAAKGQSVPLTVDMIGGQRQAAVAEAEAAVKKAQAEATAETASRIAAINKQLQSSPELTTYFKDVDAEIAKYADLGDVAKIEQLNQYREALLWTVSQMPDKAVNTVWTLDEKTGQFVQAPIERPVTPVENLELKRVQELFSDVFHDDDIQKTLEWAQENPERFVTDLRLQGRTPKSVELLKTMFPKITDEEVDAFFPQFGPEDTRLKDTLKVVFPDISLKDINGYVQANPTEMLKRIQKLGRTSQTEWFLEQVVKSSLPEDVKWEDYLDAIFTPPKATGKNAPPSGVMNRLTPSDTDARIKELLRTPTIQETYAAYQDLLKLALGITAAGLARVIPISSIQDKMAEIAQRPGLTDAERYTALWNETPMASTKSLKWTGPIGFLADKLGYELPFSVGLKGAIELLADPLNYIPVDITVGLGGKIAAKLAARKQAEVIVKEEIGVLSSTTKGELVKMVDVAAKSMTDADAAVLAAGQRKLISTLDAIAQKDVSKLDDAALKQVAQTADELQTLVEKQAVLTKAGVAPDNLVKAIDDKVAKLAEDLKGAPEVTLPKVEPVKAVPPQPAVEPVKAPAPAPSKALIKAKNVELPAVKGALTKKQTDDVLAFFGQSLRSASAEERRAVTTELRKRVLADRVANMQDRVEELIVEGLDHEAALLKARAETMTGKLPDVTTALYDDITEEMRKALFAKVYSELKDEPFELMSTSEALTNALRGQSIPRTPGVKGGSAYSRLQRVFGEKNPEILQAIDQGKSLEDVVEGQFREHTDPIPIDQETAEYLRNLPTKANQVSLGDPSELQLELVRATDKINTKPYQQWEVADLRSVAEKELALKELELKIALAEKRITKDEFDLAMVIERDKVYPYPPVTQYAVPVNEVIKTPSMLPVKDRILVVRALQEAGATAVDIGNFLRASMASFDFSWMRQAAPLIARHPQQFATANIRGWKGMWNEAAAKASWERISRRDPLFQVYEEGADFLRPESLPKGTAQYKGVEEYGFIQGSKRPIPKLTGAMPWVKTSQRGFTTSINEFLWMLYHNHYDSMLKVNQRIASGKVKLPEGQAFSMTKEMKDYAAYLADLSGRAQVGPKLGGLAPVANAMFFSLRLNMGRILTPRHLVSANPRIRREAWADLSLFVGAMGGAILAGKQLGLWDVELDARSSDFMKIRIGNTRIDPWGGYQQYVTFFSRVITKTGIVSTTGAEYEVDPIAAMTKLIRGKASPMAGLIADFWTGKTFLGDKVDVKNPKQWIDRVAPFALMDMIDAWNEKGIYGAMLSVPGMVGFAAQTYSSDWKENINKIGKPKYPDNLPFNIAEPTYDTEDFWSDHSAEIKGVDPATLTPDKGFPAIIQVMAEGQQIRDSIKDFINKPLTSLNNDPERGDTWREFYNQWQERQKITDADKLKEFDQKYKNASDGNITKRQYALLEAYYKLDEKEQRQFLKANPELNNPRDAWLKSHPTENAKLALFGQATVLTQSAYDQVLKMARELDIPDNALPNLPPKDIATDFFSYRKVLETRDDQSAEAKLIVAKADARTNGAMSKYLGHKPVTTPIPALELKVKNYDLDKDYEALDTDKEREKFRAEHPEWRYDLKKIQAYENDGAAYADKWAKDGDMGDKYGPNSAERKLYLVDNPEVYDWAISKGLLTKPETPWNVPVLRIDVKYRPEDKEYDAIDAKAKNGDGVLLRDAYLQDIKNVAYAKARIERTGYQMGLDTALISQWVEYNQLPEYGAWRERYRKEHPEFDATGMSLKVWKTKITPDDIPTEPYDQIYEDFKDKFKEYDNVQGTEKEQEAQRDAIFEGDPKFKAAWYRREAYGMLLPEDKMGIGNDGKEKNYIDLFVEYALLPDKGFERERLLLRNPEFDALMEADVPENVPDEQFDIITKKYQSQFDELEKLEGDARETRAQELRYKTISSGDQYKVEYTEFGLAELQRNAWKQGVPAELVKDYIDYWKAKNEKTETKALQAKAFAKNDAEYEKLSTADKEVYLKRNNGYATWRKNNELPNYEDDWYLIEHKAFGNKYYPSQMADFSDELKVDGKVVAYGNVPTKAVYGKYLEYYRLPTVPQALRLSYRRTNLDLDAWLGRAFDMKPVDAPSESKTTAPSQKIWDKYQEYLKQNKNEVYLQDNPDLYAWMLKNGLD